MVSWHISNKNRGEPHLGQGPLGISYGVPWGFNGCHMGIVGPRGVRDGTFNGLTWPFLYIVQASGTEGSSVLLKMALKFIGSSSLLEECGSKNMLLSCCLAVA